MQFTVESRFMRLLEAVMGPLAACDPVSLPIPEDAQEWLTVRGILAIPLSFLTRVTTAVPPAAPRNTGGSN
jgi:hypothetical protein